MGPGEGRHISVVGDDYRIVITGAETGGAFAVIDMLVPPGGGPGPHSHAAFQETFHVLEGEVEVKSGAGAWTAGPGTFVCIPRGGIVHCFKNKAKRAARLWCVVVPAGLEAFFEEIGKPLKAGEAPSPPVMTPKVVARMAALARKYGQKLYPPDFLG